MNKNTIVCMCGNILGTFDGKVAEAKEDIHIKAGIVYFCCTKCWIEKEICPNSLDIQITHKEFNRKLYGTNAK